MAVMSLRNLAANITSHAIQNLENAFLSSVDSMNDGAMTRADGFLTRIRSRAHSKLLPLRASHEFRSLHPAARACVQEMLERTADNTWTSKRLVSENYPASCDEFECRSSLGRIVVRRAHGVRRNPYYELQMLESAPPGGKETSILHRIASPLAEVMFNRLVTRFGRPVLPEDMVQVGKD